MQELKARRLRNFKGQQNYTGIYVEWLEDIDDADRDDDKATGVDDVWDFGTSSDYPCN